MVSNMIWIIVKKIIILAFLFYVWLCVVSHFQILREVSKLGLDNLDNVKPFHNEYDDSMLFAAAAAPGMDDDSMGYHPEQDQDALESVDDEQVSHPWWL